MEPGLQFPDAVDGMFALIDGLPTPEGSVRACTRLEIDFEERLPVALIVYENSNAGYIDQTVVLRVDVYARAGTAQDVANHIRAAVVGWDINVEGVGYFDSIKTTKVPRDVPLEYVDIMRSRAEYAITARPLDNNL